MTTGVIWDFGFVKVHFVHSRPQNATQRPSFSTILCKLKTFPPSPSFCILTKAPVENRDAPLPVSPWSSDRHRASEREQELERLVLMLLNHTSHTNLRSPVSECPLCEKVGGLWIVRTHTCLHYFCLYQLFEWKRKPEWITIKNGIGACQRVTQQSASVCKIKSVSAVGAVP